MTDLITRELVLATDLATAWRTITDPSRLEDWLADAVEFDPWPGGDARFVVDGGAREGWVEELTPPAGESAGRFVFWWQAGKGPASRVCLELAPAPEGVRLLVCEARPLEAPWLVGGPAPSGGATAGPPFGPSMLAPAGAR